MAVTVQDFIVNYNYTFLFLHEQFGKKVVESLWKRIEEVFCEELRCVVAEGGLIGAMDYFYGEDGITAREMPQGAHGATEDSYFERFDHCPSATLLYAPCGSIRPVISKSASFAVRQG